MFHPTLAAWMASATKKIPRSRQSAPTLARSLRKPLANITLLSAYPGAPVDRRLEQVEVEPAAALRDLSHLDAAVGQVLSGV